jgi:hypothetical protein
VWDTCLLGPHGRLAEDLETVISCRKASNGLRTGVDHLEDEWHQDLEVKRGGLRKQLLFYITCTFISPIMETSFSLRLNFVLYCTGKHGNMTTVPTQASKIASMKMMMT